MNLPRTSPPETHAHRGKLVRLPPNRVWRSYQGGRTLAALAGESAAVDSHFPEDWIASTTRATNAGREALCEGISQVTVGGAVHDFSRLVGSDPEYFLGAAHVARFGANPMLLVKLLDPAIRLHFQVHPTAAFSRQFLNAHSGKTEAYHVLATRPEVAAPYIYLGFQRPPSRERLRRLIETQDIAGIETCFDRIPVKPGDTFLVPGGVPHALGEGVFLVEIQEPSDLVVRFEFERGGYILPESARFMGRGLEFCLDVFDYTAWTPQRIAQSAACRPHARQSFGPDSWTDELIGPAQTPCFRVAKTRLGSAVTRDEHSAYIGIVTDGAVTVQVPGETHHFKRHDKFFSPAGIGTIRYEPAAGGASLLECRPPQP